MRRFLLLCFSIIVIVCVSAPVSFGYGFVEGPVFVDSALSAPTPIVDRRGGGGWTTYTQYYVNQSFFNSLAPTTTLYRVIFTIPSNEDVIFRLDGNQKVCINVTYNEQFSYRMTSYDIISGAVIDDSYGQSSTDSNYILPGYSQAVFLRNGYLIFEEGIYGSQDAFGYPISNLKLTASSSGDIPDHAWDTKANPFVNWSRDTFTVVQFINNIFGLPDRFAFIGYITGAVLILVLLDGLINFLFGTVVDLTARRRF